VSGECHLGRKRVALQIDSGTFNVVVGSIDAVQEQIKILLSVRSPVKLICEDLGLGPAYPDGQITIRVL
jgi:hypothetical protein